MTEKVKLYRVENPNIPAHPQTEGEGGTSHPALKGQWFSTDPDKALQYLPKATQYKPEGLRQFVPIDGAVVHIAEVDKDKLDTYLAANHPIVQEEKMDFEPYEDYILSAPGDVIVSTLQVDDMVGESRGKMNRLDERKKATDRVRGAIALHLDHLSTSKK